MHSALITMKVACCFTGGKDSCLVAHLLSYGLDGGGFIDPDTAGRMLPCAGSELALLVTFAPVAGPPFKAHPLPLIQLQVRQCTGTPLRCSRVAE